MERQVRITLLRGFILMLCLITTNFWTVAEYTLKLGVATIHHERQRLPSLYVQSPPETVENKWYNFSVTHMQIETTNAWKTYSFLSTIDPYDYDVLMVEWTSKMHREVTTYVTGLEPHYAYCHRNNFQSLCPLVCLRDRNNEGASLSYNMTFQQHVKFSYKKIQVFPFDYDFVTNIKGILNLAGWQHFLIVYDTHNENIAELLVKRLNHSNGVNVFKIDETGNLEGRTRTSSKKRPTILPTSDNTKEGIIHRDIVDSLLTELYFNLPRGSDLRVLLFCSLSNVKAILTQADQFDADSNKTSAMYMRSQWMVASTYSNMQRFVDFLQLLEQLDNVALVVAYSDTIRFAAAVQKMKHGIDTAIQAADRQNKSLNNLELKASFLESFITRCAPKFAAVFSLFYGKHQKRYFNKVAMVTNGELNKRFQGNFIFPNRKSGFNNRTLKLSAFQWPTFYFKNNTESPTTYDGVVLDLFTRLQTALNFTVQYISPEGLMTTDKIVEQFDKEGADLVLPVFPKYSRGHEHLFDVTIGFHKEEASAVFRKPHPDDGKWLTLIKPFRYQVHVMLFVTIAAYGVLTALMERINPFYMSRGTSLHSIVESIQYMFGALLNQGGSCLPSSVTGRVLVSFWWLFSIIIASTYGGNLIAFLTVSKESLPFENINGLIKQSKYQWGFINGTIPDDLIQRSRAWHTVYSRAVAWSHSSPDVMSPDIQTHLNRVKTRNYAFIGPSSLVKALVQSDCNLASFPIEGLCNTAAIGLVKGSPYKYMFSHMLSITQEAGLVDHWLSHRLVLTAAFCEGSLIAEAQAISLLDVQSVFYASVIGIVMSALILAVEFAVQHVSMWRRVKAAETKTSSAAKVTPTTQTDSAESSSTLWKWLSSTFNPFRKQLPQVHRTQSAAPAPRPPSWPKADTRSVWDFNTSFRRSVTDPATYIGHDGKSHSKEREESSYKRKESMKNSIAVISYSKPNLRPAPPLRRRSSFTDLRHLHRMRSQPEGRYQFRVGNPAIELNRVFLDGWFNPCFCDSDSSIDGIEDRLSDDGAASYDSGLDRSSVASTRFGDLESELW